MHRRSERQRNASRLWREHCRAPFPAGLRGTVLGGTDLVLLDADVAGCVSTWLGDRGTLDPGRTRILRRCVEELDRVLPELTGSAEIRYYERLRRLALLVLTAEEDVTGGTPGVPREGNGTR
ncbi:hypothetical protein [Streptomyces sp. NPDC049906]|uniref:hypothetical protein n=1 Tax=Streptomyces sp. NPDC049906 TaxID=3155656 RepID=UPI0034325FA8